MFLKSTVRPCQSVNRPSSSNWRSTFPDVAMCLLHFVEQNHRIRPPTYPRSVSCHTLFVANVSRRRPNEAGA